MRITAAHITDFKRLHEVQITPDADRTLVLIGGKNAQGKSSVLDALTAAFGGKRAEPRDAVRHGAESAEIRVELDGGELTILRSIAADGTSTIEVRDGVGAVRKPQAVLDRLVGARFLDPLAFLALPGKDQRRELMRMIPDAERIEDLNAKRARAFDRRTEVGRDLAKAEGELARLPEVTPAAAIDVAELAAERARFGAEQRAGDGLGSEVTRLDTLLLVEQAAATAARQKVERLQRELAEAQALARDRAEAAEALAEQLGGARAKLAAAGQAWAESAPRRAKLDADLARADAHNREVFAAEAQVRRRAEVTAEVEKLTGEKASITNVIATIDTRKAELLAAAKLPVPDLAVGDDGITLAGVPFEQASAAERLRVALGLAIACSPDLDDVWVRDGALLDDESLELLAKAAKAAKKRIWVERVGARDEGAIVIADGRVVS